MTDVQSTDAALSAPLPAQEHPAKRSRSGLVVLLLLAAFVSGIAVAIWGPDIFDQWRTSTAAPAVSQNMPQPLAGTASTAAPMTSPEQAGNLEARMATLSARMEELSAQAQNAGAYASRAEALMVAFAARRALDNGEALGYLEGELRVRFADAQPRAVATIITAASEPVTLSDLQAGLNEATPALMDETPQSDWWTSAKREVANLFVIRKATAPSRIPQKALEQARALLLAGRVEAALAEVERMPGRNSADKWLQMARRYNEARRALDVIEAAAILEPRALPMAAKADAAPPQAAPQPATNAIAPAPAAQ